MQTLKVLVAALAPVVVVVTTMASDVNVNKLPVSTPASRLTVRVLPVVFIFCFTSPCLGENLRTISSSCGKS
jgi:hypothetical protein